MYVLFVNVLIIGVLQGYPGYYTRCNSGSATRRHSGSSTCKQTFGNIFFRQLSTPRECYWTYLTLLHFLQLILPLLSFGVVQSLLSFDLSGSLNLDTAPIAFRVASKNICKHIYQCNTGKCTQQYLVEFIAIYHFIPPFLILFLLFPASRSLNQQQDRTSHYFDLMFGFI